MTYEWKYLHLQMMMNTAEDNNISFNKVRMDVTSWYYFKLEVMTLHATRALTIVWNLDTQIKKLSQYTKYFHTISVMFCFLCHYPDVPHMITIHVMRNSNGIGIMWANYTTNTIPSWQWQSYNAHTKFRAQRIPRRQNILWKTLLFLAHGKYLKSCLTL